MGRFARFYCPHCRYEEADLGYGAGREPFPFLVLFRCDNCHSIGSTWVYENKTPRCSLCYHDELSVFVEPPARVGCPKCGEPSGFETLDGEWH